MAHRSTAIYSTYRLFIAKTFTGSLYIKDASISVADVVLARKEVIIQRHSGRYETITHAIDDVAKCTQDNDTYWCYRIIMRKGVHRFTINMMHGDVIIDNGVFPTSKSLSIGRKDFMWTNDFKLFMAVPKISNLRLLHRHLLRALP